MSKSNPKPKENKKGSVDSSQSFDCCQTPPYALDPLFPFLDALRAKLGREPIIWEPFGGKGSIARTLRARGYKVIATDILPIVSLLVDPNVVECSRNAFRWRPAQFDVIVSNPPYSIKPQVYKWLAALGCPFALLVPVETIGAGNGHALLEQIDHEQLLLDTRVDFMMPSHTDWQQGSAQFPTFWSCRGLLGKQVVYGKMKAAKAAFKRSLKPAETLDMFDSFVDQHGLAVLV